MMERAPISLAAACILALQAGCSRDPLARTQVTVEIVADTSVAAETEQLEIAVRGGPARGELADAFDTRVDAPIDWPVRVAIVPKDDDASRRFEVVIGARDGDGGIVVRSRVQSGFLEGQSLLLRVELRAACVARWSGCDAMGQRCEVRAGVATCEDLFIDPSTLPAWQPVGDPGLPDGGDVLDGGDLPDGGGIDAGSDASTALDGGDDAGLDAGRDAGDGGEPIDAGDDAGDAGDAGDASDAQQPEEGCLIDLDGDQDPEVIADGESHPSDGCLYCDLARDPSAWTEVRCEQVAPFEICRVRTGVCDPSGQGDACSREGCCRFDPVWPEGATEPSPTCPFAGEDADADGNQDPAEVWSGRCDHEGQCTGCTESAQCDDGNACTLNSCDGGSCVRDHESLLGSTCSVVTRDDGICVARAGSAICLRANGQACGAGAECGSGHCADGVCCDRACLGECDRCDLAGQAGSCVASDSACGSCERCTDKGACAPQAAGDDLRDECASGACTTGSCDGMGACGVVPSGVDCGTCRSCDGAGSCALNSLDHGDCGLCQKCVAGSCQTQGGDEDLKNECTDFPCSDLIRGFNSNVCERFTAGTPRNGMCSGDSPACASLETACTGAVESTHCDSIGCLAECPLGAPASRFDTPAEACFTDFARHACPANRVCNRAGGCSLTCSTSGDTCSAPEPFCCSFGGGACLLGLSCACSASSCGVIVGP